MPISNPNEQLRASAFNIGQYNVQVNYRFQVLDNNNDFPSLLSEFDKDKAIVIPTCAEESMDNSQNVQN